MGRKKRPIYAIVAADERSPRDGRFIEDLGRYRPLDEPMTVTMDTDRVMYWLQHGAQPTDTVRSLLSKEGTMLALHLMRKGKSEEEIQQAVDAHRAMRAEKASGEEANTARARREAALKAERERVAAEEAEQAKLRAEAEAKAKAAAEEAQRKAAEEAKAARDAAAAEAQRQQEAANAAQAEADASKAEATDAGDLENADQGAKAPEPVAEADTPPAQETAATEAVAEIERPNANAEAAKDVAEAAEAKAEEATDDAGDEKEK